MLASACYHVKSETTQIHITCCLSSSHPQSPPFPSLSVQYLMYTACYVNHIHTVTSSSPSVLTPIF